jgi:UDP-N-acetylmuramoylalanine-D-glutamate ligase
VVVVGLGLSGRAAVQLAVHRGAAVTATDAKPDALAGQEQWKGDMEVLGVRFELGPHQPETLRNATQLVRPVLLGFIRSS